MGMRFPQEFRVPLGLLLILENIVGLVVNILALLSLHWARTTKPHTMNTTLIANLNVLDILLGLTLVPLTTAAVLGPQQEMTMVCIIQESMIGLASTATPLALIAISIDRYQTIVTPFYRAIRPGTLRPLLGAMWLVSVVSTGFPIMSALSSSDALVNATAPASCMDIRDASRGALRTGREVFHLTLYVLANLVMVRCYSGIFRATRQRVNSVSGAIVLAGKMARLPVRSHRVSTIRKAQERTMTRMTGLIVATFLVCWGPHTSIRLAGLVSHQDDFWEYLQICGLALALLSTVLHPVLYVLMTRSFQAIIASKWRATRRSVAHHIFVLPMNVNLLAAVAVTKPVVGGEATVLPLPLLIPSGTTTSHKVIHL